MARSEVNLKSAPRRRVERVERVGSWGRVEYHHVLDCGHVEVRKRVAPSEFVSCAGCVLAERHESRSAAAVEVDEDVFDPLGSAVAVGERETALVRAGVASRFGVPAEAVDVVVGDDEGVLRLQYVVVLLSAAEVAAILADTDISG